ncbi:MAG: fibronectin type III domain-containing protein, partial [bacterium]
MKNLIKAPYFINRNKKSSPLFILLIALTLTSILSTCKVAEAATFPWVQNNWSGGLDASSTLPTHQVGSNSAFSGWTKFSTSTNLIVGTSSITLASTSAYISKMPFNDFVSGVTSTTTVSGTSSSSVQLQTSSQFNTGVWDTPTQPPFYAGSGGAHHSVYVGSTPHGPGIYATEGTDGTNSRFWFYSLNEDKWYSETGTTTVSWGEGTALVYPGSGDYVYAFQGNWSTNVEKYSISQDKWFKVLNLPSNTFAAGADAVYSPLDGYIYAFPANNTNAFLKFSTTTEVWNALSGVPYAIVGYGGSAVYGSNNNIYVFRGYGTTDFWKYSVASSSWSVLPSTPAAIATGHTSVYSPVDNSIYSVSAQNTFGFSRYDIASSTWYTASSSSDKSIPNTPAQVLKGASLVYPGSGDYIYLLQGSSDPGGSRFHGFWKYSISKRSWTTLGASTSSPNWQHIVSVGNQYIYEVDGFTNAFYKYTISTNTWTQMHNLPSSLSGGGSNLVYASSTNSIYMMATNVSGNALWKYPIGDSNDWAAVATSSPYGSGNLTYSSYDNALYSFYSNNNSYLQRYDLATGNWTKPGEAWAFSNGQNYGITYSDYDKTLYSLSGGSNQFWYYPLIGTGSGQWHAGTGPTGTAYNNSFSMIYSPVNRSIYSYRVVGTSAPGAGDYTIMKYDVVNKNWSNFNAPNSIGSGNGLAQVGNYLYANIGGASNGELFRYTLASSYYSSGNFTSSVLDLGQNSFPTTLSWNAATSSSATVSFQLRSATSLAALATSSWEGPSSTGGFYIYPGQAVDSVNNGNRYFQYRATLSGDTTNTPTLNDVTLNYNYYSTSTQGTLVSSAYDTSSDKNILASIKWDAITPASTSVAFQVRTAPDNAGQPGNFSNFVGPGNSTSTYFTSATGSDSMPQPVNANGDRWIQYKAFLSTNDTTVTPALGTTTFTYVVNAPPQFNSNSPVSAVENSDGTVSINYSVLDPDTNTGTKNPGYVFPSFQYSLDGGSTWADIATSTLNATDSIQKVVTTSSFSNYTATWNPLAQIGTTTFKNNAKIAVKVDDMEAANHTASSTSSNFTLDTKQPSFTSMKVDATNFPSATVTLSASDDSTFYMKVGQDPNLTGATYEAYSPTKNITLTSATATVYAQFKDMYGNTTGIYSTSLPAVGAVPVKIDASLQTSQNPATIILSATAGGMKVGKTPGLTDATWTSYKTTATLTVNQGDTIYVQYAQNSDGSGNVSKIFSATLPKFGAVPIIVDESPTTSTLVTLSMASSTSIKMEVSQYQSFTGASWIDYSTTTNVTLSPGQTTAIYAKFMDLDGNITSVVSATPPTPGATSIKVDASQTPALVTLSATAATTTFYMEVGLNPDLSGATYQNYSSTTTLPLSSSNSTAYVRFKDPNGNISAINHATPPNPPSNYFFQDLSNVSTSEWREFFAWGQSDSPDFLQYNVLRSVNNGPYTPWKTITDKQTNYIVDGGLDPNSMYSYEMSIQDTNGNISFLSNPTRYDKPDGVGGSDLSAPTIDKSSVSSSDINTTGATITWTSNKFSNSVVYYIATSTYPGDVKTSYIGTIGVPSIVTSHSVKLSGLTPGTKYYFIVESTDSSGNIGHSSDSTFTFTTLPGPAITNVRNIEVQNNQAKIAWDTNIPADSTVIYSVNPDLKDPQIVSSLTPFVTDHRVTISNLTPGVQYYYFVKSVDEQNNIATNKNTVGGVDKFFSIQTTIDTVPPVISNVATSSVQVSGATVTWITDKPSTAQIEYGTTTALGNFTATTTTYDSQHVVMLNNLSQSTAYYFRVISTDESGNVASSSITANSIPYSFTTITPNSLSGAYPTNITTTGATINWTSLAPSDSKVYYVATSTYPGADKLLYKNAVGTPEATTSHSIILSGLTPGTQYYFLTESIDANGTAVQNASSSATFTTNPGPIISNIASSTSIISAVISWNTSVPTDATVVYSNSSDLSNPQTVYGTDISTTTHSVTINGLTQGSTYYYYVKSVDAENNTTLDKNVVNGSVAYYKFQTATDTSLPVISSVASSTVGAFGATVTWTTDKPSVSQIEYGTTTA